MTVRYLFDECFSPEVAEGLRMWNPSLEVEYVGKNGALPKQTPDPLILNWLEENDFYLVTNNRQTMPQHLADHLAGGRHIFGAFQVPREWSLSQIYAELELIAGASFPSEYADRIVYLPMT